MESSNIKQQSQQMNDHLSDKFNKIKTIQFYQFICQKLSFLQIIHKKIVQMINLKYTGNFNISSNNIDAQENQDKYIYNLIYLLQTNPPISKLVLDDQIRNFEKLPLIIQSLTNNLKHFSLYLQQDFDIKQPNLYFCYKTLKYLPQSLQFLEIQLINIDLTIEQCHENIFNKFQIQLPSQLQTFILNIQSKSSEYFPYIYQSIKSLPQTLTTLQVGLGNGGIGKNQENLKLLSYFLKNLPQQLTSLSLNLRNNDLSFHTQNLEYLSQGLQNLPPNLKFLKLSLENNNLGSNPQTMKLLSEAINMLPPQLNILELYLIQNNLGANPQNMKLLLEALNILPPYLKIFELYLTQNDLGTNPLNMKQLTEGLKSLPQNLNKFTLYLSQNKIGGNPEDIIHLANLIKNLPISLNTLVLNLQFNSILNTLYNIQQLSQVFPDLYKFLQNLLLYLEYNKATEEVFEYFLTQIKKVKKLTWCIQWQNE